ncbi:MAG: hypothetical protein ACYTFY_19075 [Planctomycetota bacterium]
MKKIDIGHNKKFTLRVTAMESGLVCAAEPSLEGRAVDLPEKDVSDWDGLGEMQG